MRGTRFIFFCLILSIFSLNVAFAEDKNARKFFAVQEMVSMVQKNEDIVFSVLLTRYFIEGRPYSTMMLTVSPKHTFNIVQTNDGFEALALFPKDIVHEEARRGNEYGDNLVKVKLKVLLDDILAIVGRKKTGEQINLL